MSSNKHRIEYFDVAKGILILFLLLWHYRCTTSTLPGDFPSLGAFGSAQYIIAAFFMQCFFFVSGYCTSINKPWKTFLINQVRQLLTPILVFSAISTALWSAYPLADWPYSKFMMDPSYWFLWALLLSKIIVFTLIKICSRPRFYLSASFLCMVIGVALHQYHIGWNACYYWHALGSCFVVAFGHFCKTHPAVYEKLRRSCAILYPWIMLSLSVFHLRAPVFDYGMNVYLTNIPKFLVISLSGSLAFLYYSEFVGGWIKKVFVFYGVNSLIVYATHTFWLFLFVDYFMRVIQPNGFISKAVFFFATYSCEIAVCTALILLFRLKGVRWLLGRN